jgi:hypothetical protein
MVNAGVSLLALNIKTIGGNDKRRFANASLKIGRVSIVSALALMHEAAELVLADLLFTRPPPRWIEIAPFVLGSCRSAIL